MNHHNNGMDTSCQLLIYIYFQGRQLLAGPALCYPCVFFPLARAKNSHPSSRFRSPTGIQKKASYRAGPFPPSRSNLSQTSLQGSASKVCPVF